MAKDDSKNMLGYSQVHLHMGLLVRLPSAKRPWSVSAVAEAVTGRSMWGEEFGETTSELLGTVFLHLEQ